MKTKNKLPAKTVKKIAALEVNNTVKKLLDLPPDVVKKIAISALKKDLFFKTYAEKILIDYAKKLK